MLQRVRRLWCFSGLKSRVRERPSTPNPKLLNRGFGFGGLLGLGGMGVVRLFGFLVFRGREPTV